MSPRGLLSFLIITALAVIAAAVLIVVEQVSSRGVDQGGDPMFPALVQRIDELNQVIVETPRYRMAIERRGDLWVAVALGDYPIEVEPIAEIVASLSAMTTVEPKTDNPDWYHFIDVGGPDSSPDTNSIRVTAVAADGDTLADAIIGQPSVSIGYSRSGGTFVRPFDDDQAWLVDGSLVAPGFLQDWFDTVVHVPGPEVARVAILIGGEIVLDAEKIDFQTGDYELTFLSEDVGPAGSTANDGGIRSVTQGIVSTSFDNTRPLDTVTIADDARTVRFVTQTGLQLDVTLADADGETWFVYRASAEEGSEATEQAREINAKTEHWAFLLPSYRISALNRVVTDLFEPPPEQPAAPEPDGPLLPLAPAPAGP